MVITAHDDYVEKKTFFAQLIIKDQHSPSLFSYSPQHTRSEERASREGLGIGPIKRRLWPTSSRNRHSPPNKVLISKANT